MHELSLMHHILEIAEEAAQREQAQTIRAIGLRVGAFSGVVPEALEFAFQACREGTLAETARLEIEVVPFTAYCAPCDQEFEVTDPYGIAICPKCQQVIPGVQHGEELSVSYLEVD